MTSHPVMALDERRHAILMSDMKLCRSLNEKHFKPDLRAILDEVNVVLQKIADAHFFDLSLGKWYIEGVDDSASIKKKAQELVALLKKLCPVVIKREIIPSRRSLIDQFLDQLRKYDVDQSVLDGCERLTKKAVHLNSFIINVLVAVSNNIEQRSHLKMYIDQLSKPLDDFFKIMVEILNKINYVDSIIDQLSTEMYDIEHHLVKEFVVRRNLWQSIQQGERVITVGTYQFFFVDKQQAEQLTQQSPLTFDEEERIQSLLKLFILLQKDARYKKLKSQLPYELKMSSTASDSEIEQVFRNNQFFNRGDTCVVFRDHTGTYSYVSSLKDFNHRVVQFLTFHTFKHESFNKMLNSISQQHFLHPLDALSFMNYKSGRTKSLKIVEDILKRELREGDITAADHEQILRFMKKGYDELEALQEAVVAEKKAGVKNPKYLNFIKRAYLAHQLMMHVLKLAIYSEARARFNSENELIYTGRESGFEGGNTVSVHGYNNYLKYTQMMKLVMPVLNHEKTDVFDKFEGFKAWLMMGLHDAATYDRQNAIAFANQDAYGNNNKKAHKLIGAHLMRDNELIKILFGVVDETGIDIESEGKRDLNMLATIVTNHDYGQIHFDIFNAGTDNFTTIKQLVLFSLSGLADNSAGIGFLDEHDKVHVDPWEEKGSSIFLVPAKDATTKSNGEIMFEILSRISADSKYYKSANGKAEWAEILKTLRSNVDALPNGIVKEKLIRGLENKEFSVWSATSTAGVMNSGFLRFVSYDGVTMRINIIMDAEINAILAKTIGKKYIYNRISKFLSEYKGFLHGSIEDLDSKKSITIQNTDGAGQPLHSFGLDLRIVEMKGILNMTLIEDASRQLLNDIQRFQGRQKEFKVPTELPRAA